ncbi:hypothetical protein A9Q87_09430 [Flavobacteriales bacterium 34_180_T64]|nr:hypothetical protein A9Q87_09430 [Flavobacteriales bacterium 34_180_T64]
MTTKSIKRNVILGILFFLPVIFLLMLYPSTHNYNPLDIINKNVQDLDGFSSDSGDAVLLKDHITVLCFMGDSPMDNVIAASNLKELVYDKFKGFKTFQIVLVSPFGAEDQAKALEKEISMGEYLKYLHFVFNDHLAIKHVFNSLKSASTLNQALATDAIFIIDKDLNQRGRIDDRTDSELASNKPIVGLNSYHPLEVAEIKNKMSEDVRILFTEYRQKRKGKFDSSTRRADELNQNHEQKN